MPRNPVIRSNEHFYHLTARSNNKEHFYLPVDDVWDIMLTKLKKLQQEHDLRISAFVLMSNHFHLLALTPKVPIEKIMYFFMKEVTKEIQNETGRINKIFGGRYKGCIIEEPSYLLNVYKYIYRNPVAAGITDRVENYTYSTFGKNSDLAIDKVMPINFAINDIVEIEWLNSTFQEEEAKSMKLGLSKTKFRYKKLKNARKFVEPKLPF